MVCERFSAHLGRPAIGCVLVCNRVRVKYMINQRKIEPQFLIPRLIEEPSIHLVHVLFIYATYLIKYTDTL
jgi:hypothetical protein